MYSGQSLPNGPYGYMLFIATIHDPRKELVIIPQEERFPYNSDTFLVMAFVLVSYAYLYIYIVLLHLNITFQSTYNEC